MPLNGWTSYLLNQSQFDGENSKDIVFVLLELMQCNQEVLEFCDQRNQVTKVAYENIFIYCAVIVLVLHIRTYALLCVIMKKFGNTVTVLNDYFA